MSIIESILYGFVSGLSAFLPVSSHAHQSLMCYLFGISTRNSLQEILVHIGLMFSIFVGCREIIFRLRREQKLMSATRRRRMRAVDAKSYYDLRLLKTATFPLLIGLLLYITTQKLENNLVAIMGFLLVNAFALLVAEHSRHGNRDARTMTGLDGIVMGILGALSVFPGVSRTAMIASYATVRGADSENVSNWAILLGIPAIAFAICFDVFRIVTVGVGGFSFSAFIGCLLSGAAAFTGGYVGISLLKAVLANSGFSKFAYYSIGAALFSFIIYLIT